MKYTEQVIREYADKIYGFAYSKTKNHHQAEDLSQDILVQLCDPRIDFEAIENMDAYIYRICSYTWSNYFRKNKPMWNAVNNADALEFFTDGENIEENYIQNELYERLRQEIMYLGRIRREITVMYYYENRSGEEIAEKLGIPASTVRWHMAKIKETLRERMEMTNTNEIYTPVKLVVGHSGWVKDYDMYGLSKDVLMQNICWVCREHALTMEEIARTLGVAAVYLEDKVEKMLYMDYMKTVGGNRYQTNFFIADLDYMLERRRFAYENAEKIAVPVYHMVRESMDKGKETWTFDGEFSDDLLLCALLMPELNRVSSLLAHWANETLRLTGTGYMKRKDGSEHAVSAHTRYVEEVEHRDDIDPDYRDYLRYSGGPGVKLRDIGTLQAMQLDMDLFGGWRVFEDAELKQLARVHELIEKGEQPNEYDMDGIANLVEKGYVRVDGGNPVLLIPYLRKKNWMDRAAETFSLALYRKKLEKYMDVEKVIGLLRGNVERMKKYVPAYLDKGQCNGLLLGALNCEPTTLMYALFRHGYLAMPTEEEKERVATYVWEA